MKLIAQVHHPLDTRVELNHLRLQDEGFKIRRFEIDYRLSGVHHTAPQYTVGSFHLLYCPSLQPSSYAPIGVYPKIAFGDV